MSGKNIDVKSLAAMIGGTVKGDGSIVLSGVGSLSDAKSCELSFLANKKYVNAVKNSRAGVVITASEHVEKIGTEKTLIISSNPNAAFTKVVDFFAPDPVKFKKGIDPLAFVDGSAKIAEDVSIGAFAVIEEGVEIGKGSTICAGTYVGHFSTVGADTLIYPNVTIRERSVIGSRVIIHPGTTIGADGYGFEAGPTGIIKIAQTGFVRIDDDVEIGANCSIDRARFGKTWIKKGVKIDNQVHIAHNVTVGEFSMLVGQCGIAGSAEIGRGVIIAAKAGINGHIKIGDGAKIAGTSGVVKDVAPGESVVGTPAEPPRDFLDRLTLPKKVQKINLKIMELEQKLKELADKL